MALLFIDGFDKYSTSEISQKWPTIAGSPTINATGGRDGTGALILDAAGEYVQRSLPSNYATLVVGARVKVSSIASNTDYLYFLDAGTNQVKIRIRTDGKVEAFRGTTSLGSSSTAPIAAGTSYYLEAKVTFHGSTGIVSIYVDGSLVLSLTGQNTISTANAYANQIRFNCDAALTVTIDDVYTLDTSGSAPQNDVLGDVRVDTVIPDVDGTYEQFALSAGTDSFALLDDAAPDGDSTEIHSSTVGDKTTLGYAAMPSVSGGTILGVQVGIVARKDSAGSRQIKAKTRTGGSDYAGSGQALSTSYLWYGEIWATNPNTAVAWSETEVNAAEFGVEIHS